MELDLEKLANEISKYGKITIIIRVKTNLNVEGLYQVSKESVSIYIRLMIDIPSIIEIQGFKLRISYEHQPKTYLKCGKNDHVIGANGSWNAPNRTHQLSEQQQ